MLNLLLALGSLDISHMSFVNVNDKCVGTDTGFFYIWKEENCTWKQIINMAETSVLIRRPNQVRFYVFKPRITGPTGTCVVVYKLKPLCHWALGKFQNFQTYQQHTTMGLQDTNRYGSLALLPGYSPEFLHW